MGWHNNPLYDDLEDDPDVNAAIGYYGDELDDEDDRNPRCTDCGERYDHEPWCLTGALIAKAYWEEMAHEDQH